MGEQRIDLATIASKLDAVLASQRTLQDSQHALQVLVHRMTVQVDVLSSTQAASRLGVGVRTIERITAQAIFTDARSPERRVKGSPRVYYADEIEVYRSEGERGVKRLREELGRL